LGVNATRNCLFPKMRTCSQFQWAPTLGGECYSLDEYQKQVERIVSMGTHPWG